MPEPRAIVGDDDIRPGRNRSGASITEARIVKLDPANAPDAVATAVAATDTLYGVAAETIADLANGDVQTGGKAVVTSGAAVAAGARVTSDAVGRAVTAAPAAGVNNGLLGVALTASTALGQDIEVELAGPGATIQG